MSVGFLSSGPSLTSPGVGISSNCVGAKGGGGADRFENIVSPNAIVPADTAANTVSNHTPVLNIGTNPGGNGISMESDGGDNRASGGAGGGYGGP